MNDISWDDLKVFVQVAKHGSLAAAAKRLGISPPTAGRAMTALEEATGRSLFIRRQTGYGLTDDGQALFERAVTMEAQAKPIEEWARGSGARRLVRISAGTWTSHFIAENFGRLWSPEDGFAIEFRASERRLDIAHRHIDIGLRNSPPDDQSLAGRRTVSVAFAPFRARGHKGGGPLGWIAITPDSVGTRTGRWVLETQPDSIVAWANTPRMLFDLALAGVGQALLPCFAGDREPRLERAGPPVEALGEHQWLVVHHETRHRPEVRTAVERLAALLVEHRALFAGQRPLGGEASVGASP